MSLNKKNRILIVMSGIWFLIVLIFAIGAGESSRSFDFSEFFTVLTIGALIPLAILYGALWIRSASK